MSETVEVNYVFRGKGKPMQYDGGGEVTDRCQCTNCDHLLVEKFKQERDEAVRWKEAYREVAQNVWIESEPHPHTKDDELRAFIVVDAEAKRIFEDQKRVDAHLAFIDHEIKRKE